MARRFAELQKAISSEAELDKDVRLLSITLDPEFDREIRRHPIGEYG